MKKNKCLICGCYDLDPSLVLDAEDQICWNCKDEYTVKPNKHKVMRIPYKVYRNLFGKLVIRDAR